MIRTGYHVIDLSAVNDKYNSIIITCKCGEPRLFSKDIELLTVLSLLDQHCEGEENE